MPTLLKDAVQWEKISPRMGALWLVHGIKIEQEEA